MAEAFESFSFLINLPSAEAQTYALELHALANRIRDAEGSTGALPEKLADQLMEWTFEAEAETKDRKPVLWLYSKEFGVNAVCAFVQHLLQRFDPSGRVVFEWSRECAKPCLDTFGGGAAVITATAIKTMTTAEWLEQQAA